MLCCTSGSYCGYYKIAVVVQVQVQIHIHAYSITMQQQWEKKEVKTELTIHWIKHNKGKKCVAAKGAKPASWLLPQSGFKWVEVIQYL